ncbi:MFS general substrate transporter [Trichoderma sp. SZMC 28014]
MMETCQIEHELSELHEREATDGAVSNLVDSPHAKATTNPILSRNNVGQRPECFKNTFQEICFILMATLAMATNSLVTGAMIIVTASIGRDLHMTQAQITWISAATTLSAGALQLPLGQLTDLLGRKAFFISGMIGFSASSLILGFSRNPFWMNILCGFLGLFSAVIVPPAIGILGAAYSEPSKRKNWAFACFSAGNPVGFGLGSIIMGISARIFDWRAGFFFFTILWGLLAIVSIWVVPDIEAYEPGPFRQRLRGGLKQFDIVGTALTIIGVGLFTTGLTLGPGDGWKSAHVIAMLIVGFFLLVGFVIWERICPNPLMPLHIWRDKGFSFLMPVSIFGVMAMLSSNFWLALFIQEVHHRSALAVAVQLLPQVISAIISNIVAANILHRVNNSLIMAFGAAMYLVANLLLAIQNPSATYWAFIFPSLLTNVMGLDLQFNVTNMYVMQSLPSHQQSLAGGIFNMFIRLGTTIIFGMSTAVYSSVKDTPEGEDNGFKPFQSAFYVSLGFAALACLFVPFLRIGTQGNSPKEE